MGRRRLAYDAVCLHAKPQRKTPSGSSGSVNQIGRLTAFRDAFDVSSSLTICFTTERARWGRAAISIARERPINALLRKHASSKPPGIKVTACQI